MTLRDGRFALSRRVVGVARSGGTMPGVDEAIGVDLRDPDEARRRLAPAGGATHLFFAAYLPRRAGPRRNRPCRGGRGSAGMDGPGRIPAVKDILHLWEIIRWKEKR
jgi:hypothetical protein